MARLLLDAAYPPSPQQWIADMDAVGAAGGFVYVWGPITRYSQQHVVAARNARKIVVPIVVPGNTWPSTISIVQSLQSYGFTSGPVMVDLEAGSLPPNIGLVSFASAMMPLHYQVDRYGNISTLGAYAPEGQDWIADWIRTGVLDPLPTLPAGWQSWQFVNDININGSQYDASMVADTFVTEGTDMALDPTDGIVQEFRERLNDIEQMLANGKRQGASFAADGTPTYIDVPQWPFWLLAVLQADQTAIVTAVADVKTALGSLQVPPADLQPAMDALSKLSAHLGLGTA